MKAQAHLLFELTSQMPPRLLKKLDADPNLAKDWTWNDDGTVLTSSGETVTAELEDGVLCSLDKLTCSCLLAPRCLHRLAVLSVLETADKNYESATGGETAVEEPEPSPSPVVLSWSEPQHRAIERLSKVGAHLLESGATSCGVVFFSEMLRVAYDCRGLGLYRAATAVSTVCQSLRELREKAPNFSLERLAEEVGELLWVAHRLSAGDPEALGTARRAYTSVGHLKLWGLYCEPVITGSGYAGCVTTLTDQAGRLFTVSDLAPGDPTRVYQAYETAHTLPGLAASLRELSKGAVVISNATASAEGRLGGGKDVQAAYLGEGSPPLDLSLEVTVLGKDGDSILVESTFGPLRLRGIEHPSLPTQDNMHLLARRVGATLRVWGRRDTQRERTFIALSLEHEGERYDLGLQRLQSALFSGLNRRAPEARLPDSYQPFASFQRQLTRVVRSGRQAARRDFAEERAWREQGLETAALLWQAVVDAASAGSRDIRGLWQPEESQSLAQAWLAAMVYLQTANRVWHERAWLSASS